MNIFFHYLFVFLLLKSVSPINYLSKSNTINSRLLVPLYTASTNTIFPTFNWYFLHTISCKADLYSTCCRPANRAPFSQKATVGNRQLTSSVHVRIKPVFGNQYSSISTTPLGQLAGGLTDEYVQPTKQEVNFLHGPTQLGKSTQQADAVVAEQQRALMLTGYALLFGVGYIVYARQQRTIRLLIQQKAEIARQLQHLELIDQKKISLFSLISHDLRLPLVRLKQQLYMLRQANSATAPISQQIQESEEQVDQLARMLTNLLDWSVVQMKGLPTNPKPVDLSVITAEVIADVSAQLKHKEIRLINQVSESTWIIADRYQLLCVIRNLVSNAIKFTPPQGYVRLYTKPAGEAYTSLTVQDTGIGMSADQVARALSAPVIRSGTQGEPGTGLGLLLCRELLGDDPDVLQLTSQPGKGTSVVVRLITADKPVC